MTSKTDAHQVDRHAWPPGPWDHEPEDRLEWRAEGFPALMIRNRWGAWCGYIGVPPEHPWHGRRDVAASVHGGLTYTGPCRGHVCHVPRPGETDDIWWLGFDCAHAWDRTPILSPRMPGTTYRDIAFVRREIAELATQARSAR